MAHADTKKIGPVSRGEWPRAIETFNRANKGRSIKIESYWAGREHEHADDTYPLYSLTYNAPESGNSLVVAVGEDRAEREYRVDAPAELWVESVPGGQGEAMEIIDAHGRHVAISIE